jgi:hypothetical protein
LKADVERNELLLKERALLEQQDAADNNPEQIQAIAMELGNVYERMTQIGADSAEGRAATILTGLQAIFIFVRPSKFR